eukprot:1266939-Alexandrium_andersonii.AAC.1
MAQAHIEAASRDMFHRTFNAVGVWHCHGHTTLSAPVGPQARQATDDPGARESRNPTCRRVGIPMRLLKGHYLTS